MSTSADKKKQESKVLEPIHTIFHRKVGFIDKTTFNINNLL